jgi:hypothetical protein
MEPRNWKLRLGIALCIAVLLSTASLGFAEDKVHTNPLNLDPAMQEAYHYF